LYCIPRSFKDGSFFTLSKRERNKLQFRYTWYRSCRSRGPRGPRHTLPISWSKSMGVGGKPYRTANSEYVLLMPQFAAAVARRIRRLEVVLCIAPEKSDTSQFFIISPESPVRGMASPVTELTAIVFLASASKSAPWRKTWYLCKRLPCRWHGASSREQFC
jgi:hypothetical protein